MHTATTSQTLANQYILKKYTDQIYRLILFNQPIRPGGFEEEKRRDIYDEKLGNSISRTRAAIYEYAICNLFDYFMTITLDPKKYNRYDLEKYIKDLGQWIRDLRKRTGKDIQYLLIPELHKDGAYHMHGLVKGLSEEDLEHFSKKQRIPAHINKMLRDGRDIYDWLPYAEKFGFCTVEAIKSQEAISRYITKYIKKDVGLAVKEKNKKSYYCSRGLKRAETIKKGTLPASIRNGLEFSFINKYVTLFDLDGQQASEVLRSLLDPL